AMRHHQRVRFDLGDEALRFEVGDDALPRLEALEAAISLGRIVVEPRITVEDVDELEAMPAPDLEIVEIMRRSDLDRTASRGGIGIIVGDDRNAAADQRQDDVLSDEFLVALVLG